MKYYELQKICSSLIISFISPRSPRPWQLTTTLSCYPARWIQEGKFKSSSRAQHRHHEDFLIQNREILDFPDSCSRERRILKYLYLVWTFLSHNALRWIFKKLWINIKLCTSSRTLCLLLVLSQKVLSNALYMRKLKKKNTTKKKTTSRTSSFLMENNLNKHGFTLLTGVKWLRMLNNSLRSFLDFFNIKALLIQHAEWENTGYNIASLNTIH